MINKAAQLGPSQVSWWLDWRDQCAFIVASGPSAKTAGVEKLEGKAKVIVVNDSYRLAPWADVLYSCDMAWWQLHRGVPGFKGLKLTHEPLALHHFKDLRLITIEKTSSDDILVERPTCIGSGGNSGFQALNLAIQFGSIKIGLIGVDCRVDHGEHWHGRHPVPLNNPMESNAARWRGAFNRASGQVSGLGLEVINCSPISMITAYPKMSVEAVMERWGL